MRRIDRLREPRRRLRVQGSARQDCDCRQNQESREGLAASGYPG
jgi:hypothetical protein